MPKYGTCRSCGAGPLGSDHLRLEHLERGRRLEMTGGVVRIIDPGARFEHCDGACDALGQG